MRRLSGEKLKYEDFYIKKSALLMFNYFTQRSQRGKDRQEFNLYTKCVARERQNARSDRVCLDFFFGYFLLIK